VLWPALLAEPLGSIAAQMATSVKPAAEVSGSAPVTAKESSPQAARIATQMGALVGRLMPRGGWVASERHAGAEPLWTGRARPYDESTLRKQARRLAQRGGSEIVARAVEAQVHKAVGDAKTFAYTDMFDQVYWTKKPAYAAPIGNRGNRLLAATYFGLTFVRCDSGPALAYHVSWHKPASPLQDGLEALHRDEHRATWLTAHSDLHLWDRGGSGTPTLRWAAARGIPYLTITRGATRWTRYRGTPRVRTRSKLPVFVRPDRKVGRALGTWRQGPRERGAPRVRPRSKRPVSGRPARKAGRTRGTCRQRSRGKSARAKPLSPRPEQVIFPAHPDKAGASTKALRYRTGRPLTAGMLRKLDRVYKTRWPANENAIKALVAVGFDRNLDRGLTPTTSRGTDGALARLETREQELVAEVQAFIPTRWPQTSQAIRRFYRKKSGYDAERARIEAIPQDKGARMPTGAEALCKNLMLLMHNALALLLRQSPLKPVQTMSLPLVHDLLLSRSMLAGLDPHGTTLWIDPVPSTSERALQQELVRLFNEQSLSLRGRRLFLRLRDPPRDISERRKPPRDIPQPRDPPAKMPLLRVSG
jgi:hypothetical protein